MSALIPPGLATPATLVLADRMERNLAAMATFAAEIGVDLRPHAKTHKCCEIARRQIELGAIGVSVATLGEAEMLASDSVDIDDFFIAYPFWAADDTLVRLQRLARRAKVSVGLDSPEAADRLAKASELITTVIEVDCGLGRSGVAPTDAVAVAQAADRAGLKVAGVFTFPGQSYSPGAADAAARSEASVLLAAAESLSVAGFPNRGRSGGSTPSARAVQRGELTELRPGVYVFNDAQQVELGTVTMDEVALVVAGTVVSRPARGRIVLDAGAKVLGPDRPAWASGHGRLAEFPAARITGLWEHHAVVQIEEPRPRLGEQVAIVPNHVCTAVNLVPTLTVVEQSRVVDEWKVVARAANR
jgi:D-serine deaminase-like pyridoxal phosphate-dependent protein